MNESLLTPSQVAKLLGVSTKYVRDHAKRAEPRIRAVNLGSSHHAMLRFRREDVEAFIGGNFV